MIFLYRDQSRCALDDETRQNLEQSNDSATYPRHAQHGAQLQLGRLDTGEFYA